MLFRPKKVQAFGLDISDSSIKVMQLSKHKHGFFPTAYSILESPKSLIANHLIADEQKLADYITQAVRAAKHIDTKYVVASVPEAKSFVRILKIPGMSETEIDRAISWELEQDIPLPIDQVYLDWEIVKQDADVNHVLVMATPKDYVDSLVNAIKLAKLKPIAIELESQAVARSLVGTEQLGQSTLVIDISTMITSFVIVSSTGVLEYTSNIPVGGQHISESISNKLGVAIKEAEEIKITTGLMGESKKGNLSQAILPVLDQIVDEIRNVVNFHKDHSLLSTPVNKIILCGGGARLQGLPDYINARLTVGAAAPIEHIVLGNPWINIGGKDVSTKIPIDEGNSLAYATAIGLALRGVGK